MFTRRSSFLHIRIVCSKCRKYIVLRCGNMIWLILFLPAVIVWACVLFIHVKSGKSNHQYHEPLIFYSQRVSPFRVEHSKNNYKDDIEKAIENDSFFYSHIYLHTLFYYLHTLCLVKIIIRRKSLRIKVSLISLVDQISHLHLLIRLHFLQVE